jgi:DNA-binding MarR family transcriptional regulator
VSGLLAILRITKQSLARVLNALVDQGYVSQAPGYEDRRLRLLTLTEQGKALEQRLFEAQREKLSQAYRTSGPQAVQGFRTFMRAMMDSGARAYMDGTGPAEDA